MRVRHLSVWMLLACIVSACASGRPMPTDAARRDLGRYREAGWKDR